MSVREYIGARYVPIFGREDEDTIIWDNTKPYEPLTVVLYQGNSYTSRQYVPVGIDIDNGLYWAETGNYNAQVEQYRQEVLGFDGRISAVESDVTTINANGWVTTARIADGAVTGDKFANGTVTSDKIADDAVTGDKIADGAVNTVQIVDGAVTGDKIADGAVNTAQIADDSVTPAKLADSVYDELDSRYGFDVIDSAEIGSNMKMAGAFEFRTNDIAGSTTYGNPHDYLNGACVLGDIAYYYSDTGDNQTLGVFRKFNMTTGELLNTTRASIAKHPAAMSAYDESIYLCCTSNVNSANTALFEFDLNFNLRQIHELNERIYAVVKTVDRDVSKGLFVGFSRDNNQIVNFNLTENGIDIINRFSCPIPKTTNGMTLARNDTMLCINTLANTSTVVIDISNGNILGECSIRVSDTPVELEDSFEYNGHIYLAFAINHDNGYKTYSAGIGLCILRLFSDAPIDIDFGTSWMFRTNRVTCYVKHLVNQNCMLIGDGSINNPIGSMVFATALISHLAPLTEIRVKGETELLNFPLIQGNKVYVTADTSDDSLKVDDYISVAFAGDLRLYATHVTGYLQSNSTAINVLHSNASIHVTNITAVPTRTFNITDGSMVTIGTTPNRIREINVDHSTVFYSGSTIAEDPTVIASQINYLPLGTGNALEKAIRNASSTRLFGILINASNGSNFIQAVLRNSPEHGGTFTGTGYSAGDKTVGLRMYYNAGQDAVVLDAYKASDNSSLPYTINSACIVS